MANFKKRVKGMLKKAKLAAKNPIEKQKYIENQAKKMAKKPTKPEAIFVKMCKELKIKIVSQEILGGKIFDYRIFEKKILIEVDGTYFHGYDKTFIEKNGMQKKAYFNDLKKDLIALQYGFKLIRIWEHDLIKDYENTKNTFKEQVVLD